MSLVLIIIIINLQRPAQKVYATERRFLNWNLCHRSHYFGHGLEPWLNDHLMFLAPPITVFLEIYKYVMHGKYRKSFVGTHAARAGTWYFLSMPIYAFHQLEEHGFDLYGRRYHFISYVNSNMESLGMVIMAPTLITTINRGTEMYILCCCIDDGTAKKTPLTWDWFIP